MSIPNIITLGRLLAVPVAVWLIISDKLMAGFWVFLAAGISDAVDGFIAKRFGAETEIGRILDPLADKALLVSVYVALGYQGYLNAWLVILVVFRDVLIIGGALLFQALSQTLTLRPLMVSKVNTGAQIFLAAWVLGVNGFGVDDRGFTGIAVYVVAATTLLSGFAYLITWGRRAGAMERRE